MAVEFLQSRNISSLLCKFLQEKKNELQLFVLSVPICELRKANGRKKREETPRPI